MRCGVGRECRHVVVLPPVGQQHVVLGGEQRLLLVVLGHGRGRPRDARHLSEEEKEDEEDVRAQHGRSACIKKMQLTSKGQTRISYHDDEELLEQ